MIRLLTVIGHGTTLLPHFIKHYQQYVDEIKVLTKRIDSLIDESEMPNFLNIDIQGAELAAIQSLGALIRKVDYIFVEVNRREVYKECTKVDDLDLFLEHNGFKRVTTRWYFKQGWGDALYIRKIKIRFTAYF
jgi:hypothetical protein